MKKILVILFTNIIWVSCQKKEGLLTDYFSQEQEYVLKEMKDYPIDSIGHPDIIFSFEDYILLAEPKLDTLLSLYNIVTKKFERFLPKGNGPNELLDIQQINPYKNDSSFFIRSTFGDFFYIYSLNNKFSMPLQKIQIPSNAVSSYFDNAIIISSMHGKKRFSLHDEGTGSFYEFGDSITIGHCSQEIVSHILQGLCTGSTKLKRFAWASIYGDAFEIYDYSHIDNIKKIKSHMGILPIISMAQNQPTFSADSKLGIPSLTATDKFIYALYNENVLRDFSNLKDDIFSSKKILIYDWDGNPVKVLKTDKYVRSISYNRKQNKIYCVGYENLENKVFFINIEEIRN